MIGEVRRWATGFVDRASCPDAKLPGIHAGHPSGFSFAHLPLQRGGKFKGSAQRAPRLGDRLRDHHRLCVVVRAAAAAAVGVAVAVGGFA